MYKTFGTALFWVIATLDFMQHKGVFLTSRLLYVGFSAV